MSSHKPEWAYSGHRKVEEFPSNILEEAVVEVVIMFNCFDKVELLLPVKCRRGENILFLISFSKIMNSNIIQHIDFCNLNLKTIIYIKYCFI